MKRLDSSLPPAPLTNQRLPRRRKAAKRPSRRKTGLLPLLPVLAALIAGAAFLSWTDGGRSTRLADPLSLQLDRLAESVGLGLQEITVAGHRRTKERDIYAAMNLSSVRSFILFDSETTKQRIEALPWVDKAEVRRSFPWRVEVHLSERTPFAIWRHHGADIVIDRTGRHLQTVEFGRVRSLPLVAGPAAEPAAHEIIDAVARWPDLLLATSVARRVDGRRWDLILSESRRIQLPERGFVRALTRLMSGRRGKRLFDKRFTEIDLRLSDKIAVRQRKWAGDRYGLPRPVLSRSVTPGKASNRS